MVRNCAPENPFLPAFVRHDGFRAQPGACHRARIRATRWGCPGMTQDGDRTSRRDGDETHAQIKGSNKAANYGVMQKT
jgi:hypothetical protein